MITTQPARGAWQPIGDGLAAAERLLTKLRHDPAAIAMTVGAPVVLVVIFGYIFGSAISVPGGGNYRAYLVPACSSRSRPTSCRRWSRWPGTAPEAWSTGSGRCRSAGRPSRSGRPPPPPCTGW